METAPQCAEAVAKQVADQISELDRRSAVVWSAFNENPHVVSTFDVLLYQLLVVD